ncbi:TniQ family protein [Hoeflea sp. 108]|uniref:TniQ family protein n=1 Tax=Hoeflea sp. 108 TaxID=1116369 RepID=UPI0003796778|nr:TniQ family protein [Hoeflea sp. 108]
MITAPTLTRLPVVPRPEKDERLSSWMHRLARLYAMPIDAFLEHCGLSGRRIGELEWRLGAGEGALLARRTGISLDALRALTFAGIGPHARLMIATSNRYVCPHCRAGVNRKTAALPWNLWCGEHQMRFRFKGGGSLQTLMSKPQLMALDRYARASALRMADWTRGRDEGAPSIEALLDFLTTRHRKPSPPSLDEQPVLSLEARRANHAFLTRPIARQALLVIVPEYDRVAPILAKPVPRGLFALAHGSLLQNYALAVGLGRLSADPAGYAAAVLLASDPEGEERLRETLRAWPLKLRRRIYGRFRRLRDAQNDAHRDPFAGKRRPVSQFRFTQSHNHARGIS